MFIIHSAPRPPVLTRDPEATAENRRKTICQGTPPRVWLLCCNNFRHKIPPICDGPFSARCTLDDSLTPFALTSECLPDAF